MDATAEFVATIAREAHALALRVDELTAKLAQAEADRTKFRDWWFKDQEELKAIKAAQNVVALRPESA